MNSELLLPNHVGIIMDGNGRWAQEKAAKVKRTKGEDKELSKLLEFRKRQAYA